MEQCAICLENLVDQVIGIPEHCKHKFCFQCLSNWTQVRERKVEFSSLAMQICFSKVIHAHMIVRLLHLFSKSIPFQVEGLMPKYD